jgi:hypothetical protein
MDHLEEPSTVQRSAPPPRLEPLDAALAAVLALVLVVTIALTVSARDRSETVAGGARSVVSAR